MKLGAIVGRFQTPYLHPGHLALIATALRENDRTIIILGTEQDHLRDRENNPYTLIQRRDIISKIFPQVLLLSIKDRDNDLEWSNDLDKILSRYISYNITLYHSRDSFINSYYGIYKTKEIEQVGDYSATQIRNNQ